MDDITTKLEQSESSTTDLVCTYLIQFQILTQTEENGEKDWADDELQIRGTDDANTALARLIEFLGTSDYPLPVEGFKLTSIKMISEADY